MKTRLLFFIILLISLSVFSVKTFTYTIQSGDSLEKIANKFNLPLSVIIDYNPDYAYKKYIYAGEKLIIPEKAVFEYTVKSGDNLSYIAKTFFSDATLIAKYNNITNPNLLYIGQKLEIPYEYIGLSFNKNVDVSWPVWGEITSLYGWRIHPIYNEKRFHSGVDIALSEGLPILASVTGKVVEVKKDNGYGIYVKIKAGTHYYIYAHMSEALTVPGSIVKKGEVIGRVGSTGISTGPHVHFEVRTLADKSVDPMGLLPGYKYAHVEIEKNYMGGN
jgi:murein DD-endopeptidase MepM/ murein hydrolase activator NlpD